MIEHWIIWKRSDISYSVTNLWIRGVLWNNIMLSWQSLVHAHSGDLGFFHLERCNQPDVRNVERIEQGYCTLHSNIYVQSQANNYYQHKVPFSRQKMRTYMFQYIQSNGLFENSSRRNAWWLHQGTYCVYSAVLNPPIPILHVMYRYCG